MRFSPGNEGLKSLLSCAHRGWVEVIDMRRRAFAGVLNPICRFPAPVASLRRTTTLNVSVFASVWHSIAISPLVSEGSEVEQSDTTLCSPFGNGRKKGDGFSSASRSSCRASVAEDFYNRLSVAFTGLRKPVHPGAALADSSSERFEARHSPTQCSISADNT
jgi:hypothetical protein